MTLISLLTGPVADEQKPPMAVPAADPAYGVVGSVVRLDGQASEDPFDSPLTYNWSFVSIPIGSKVDQEAFRQVSEDGSIVTFSPDIVGEYVVSLTVSNGVIDSAPASITISIRALLVPHGRGLVPDGKWIWSYIRDVWEQVDGKEWFETFWSALTQLTGAEALRLYQVDFNKSIRDIQDMFQRRWLSYEPKLTLVPKDCTFYIGNNYAGTNATTQNLGLTGQLIVLSNSEVIIAVGTVLPNVVGQTLTILYDDKQPDNIQSYRILGVNTTKTGYKIEPITNPSAPPALVPDPVQDKILTNASVYFSFQSDKWQFAPASGVDTHDYATEMSKSASPMDFMPNYQGVSGTPAGVSEVRVGDVVHFPAGLNAGFYRITSISGSYFTVAKKPASFSNATSSATYKVNVYRPSGYKISQPDTVTSDTLAIPYSASMDLSVLAPGRVLVVAGQAYTILRAVVDRSGVNPMVIITTDGGTVITGQYGLTWRTPHTLVSSSQNFEELGVSTGDLFTVDVTNVNTQLTVSVAAQVVGVSNNRIGFVLTDEAVTPGVVPEVPDKTYLSLSTALGIPSVFYSPTGQLIISGDAKVIVDYINSQPFKTTYWNKELTPSSDILIKGGIFRLTPRSIIRNRRVPVQDTLLSIPTLQDWIVQPDVTEVDGKVYQNKKGVLYEIKARPVSLVENGDYIIDDELAISDDLTFKTGTDIVECGTGHFLSRDIRPGDKFSIVEPVTLVGDYTVVAVLSDDTIKLSRPIPKYILSDEVTANVRVTRKAKGRFLRFVPGGFTALKPAPDRLWAEVAFFDNSDAIEANFGIMVGLKKEDLNKISENVHYRQAVAGLMYAFTNGSSIDSIRLGAQILLGLPFAEHRGIIRSIEGDYRLDRLGNPVLGRLLIEDVDQSNAALGTQRVYTYPVEGGSKLAGLEDNPLTGKPYAVGDIVQLFAPLSKGIEVIDYLIESLHVSSSGASRLQQFHTIRMRANDTVFSFSELELVSSFLKKITPSYVAFKVASAIELYDNVVVEDSQKGRLIINPDALVDDASFNIPPSLMFDGRSGLGGGVAFFDEGFYWVRKVGKDLDTTYDSLTPSTVGTATGGGLVTPEYGEGPVSRVGDILRIHGGPNDGAYLVSVVTDSDVTVIGLPASGFQTASGQHYSILRPIKALIKEGMASITNGNPVVSATSGQQADGVSPGDWILIQNLAGTAFTRHAVIRVGGGPVADGYSPALNSGEVHVTPTPTETAAGRMYYVYRPQFLKGPFEDITPDINPVNPVGDNFYVISDPQIQALIDIGDELQDTDGSMKRYVVLDPASQYVTPPLPAGTITVKLIKKGHNGPISRDHREYDPSDPIAIGLKETNSSAALCTSGSRDVTLRSKLGASPYVVLNPASQGILPGDLLQLLNGPNSTVDVGYGPGIYPIVEVTSLVVKLAAALTDNTDSAWVVIRRR